MSPSVGLWLCLCLPLLSAVVSVGGQADGQNKPQSHIKLEPFWSGEPLGNQGDVYVPEQNLVAGPEVLLDLDRHRRLARGAEDEEQQSTFGQSYENDSVPTPQATDFNTTEAEMDDENRSDDDENNHHGNASNPDHTNPGLFNPFYPLVESSYSAYAVLFLAGLVLAVGVVGNMAVICIVWNNYYMRSAWNYLLASMAFWDFWVLVLCLPVVVINQLSHRRILGDITCRLVPYMEVGGAYGGGGGALVVKVFPRCPL